MSLAFKTNRTFYGIITIRAVCVINIKISKYQNGESTMGISTD